MGAGERVKGQHDLKWKGFPFCYSGYNVLKTCFVKYSKLFLNGQTTCMKSCGIFAMFHVHCNVITLQCSCNWRHR